MLPFHAMSMLFRTSSREYRNESAVGLLSAIRKDAVASPQARRPDHAFLRSWLEDIDDRLAGRVGVLNTNAEAMALELLFLCHEYGLGSFVQADVSVAPRPSGEQSTSRVTPPRSAKRD